MIAVDTNVLVYARRTESPHHAAAKVLIGQLAEGSAPWALPWPVVYEFVRVVTHPRVFDPPSPLEAVVRDLESLLASPSLTMLGEGPGHVRQMTTQLRGGGAAGNLAHDAHIAALLVEHGVTELLTADRDFARFPGVRSRNPFVS
jgi:toxin-antitoxin system PIN domain toxin